MNEYKRVHCIGIGGVGVSAIAKLLRTRGVVVSGSDATDSDVLTDLKSRDIKVWIGSKPQQMGRDIDLVIYSSAVPEDDEERVRARHLDIREVTYNAFLGEISKGMRVVAVTGAHGKSTTTAMLGSVLIDAGLDPTVIVGSRYPHFKAGNLQIGNSDLFVVEACEHQAHMLHLDPSVIVITNIEHDHPDYYQDVAHVRRTMQEFVEKLPKGGMLVWNRDDKESKKLVEVLDLSAPAIEMRSFGTAGDCNAVIAAGPGRQMLDITCRDGKRTEAALPLPGIYNAFNALAAFVTARSLGVPIAMIKASLEGFKGIWRRFEHLGAYKGTDVYTDYAHHPTAIASLLEGVKQFIPNRRIVFVFQPHQHARTKGLLETFAWSFDKADVVILPEIYDVVGRNEQEGDVSSRDIVTLIKERDELNGVQRPILYTENFSAMQKQIDEQIKEGDILLIAGAGDIDPWVRTNLMNL